MEFALNVIGPQVRRLRNQRGWSQNKLAIKLQLAGMDYATRGKVCKIEARKVWVSNDDMLFLAYALGVELTIAQAGLVIGLLKFLP